MNANEFVGWQAYFDIYPFTQEREDARTALLAQMIANMSGKSLKKSVKLSAFLPVYIESEKIITDPLQRDEYRAFKQRLQDVKG
jgi:hypothetical protein